MYLSIYKIDDPKLINLLALHNNNLASCDFSLPISQFTRRSCALAIAKDLLIKNQLCSLENAKSVTIQHHTSGEPFLKLQNVDSPLPLHISISHSGSWLACLISPIEKAACIDLEDLS